MISRIGGDEFAVILHHVGESEVADICRRFRNDLESSKTINGLRIPLQLSYGYAVSPDPSITSIELFRLADNRMYRDKVHRRGTSRGAIVLTLKQMLAERDFLTEDHAERIQDLVVELGEAAGLPASDMPDLRLFAQFHDIGKVGIPDRILNKPGPLTPEERIEIQRHCEIGHRIAQSSPELLPIAEWILRHQEWWNGSGYPLGIRREEIPIQCRILSIIDAYDAMTSDRPYRSALLPEAALQELQCCSGTQFDPHLVPLFIQLIQKSK
jgi:HD-GYP domain-containing protein (c-di-GMP phosphodiesterase class II)